MTTRHHPRLDRSIRRAAEHPVTGPALGGLATTTAAVGLLAIGGHVWPTMPTPITWALLSVACVVLAAASVLTVPAAITLYCQHLVDRWDPARRNAVDPDTDHTDLDTLLPNPCPTAQPRQPHPFPRGDP